MVRIVEIDGKNTIESCKKMLHLTSDKYLHNLWKLKNASNGEYELDVDPHLA